MFEIMDSQCDEAVIKVIGIGGAGLNLVEQMMGDSVEGVQFIVMDTEPQALGNARADCSLLLGSGIIKGADVPPEVERHITQTDRESLQSLLVGTDMVFIIAGMGGDTGIHIASAVAKMACEMGILTVAMVAESCSLDDEQCMSIAKQGRAALISHVDSLFTLPSDIRRGEREYDAAFKAANYVAMTTIRGIVELISRPGLINVEMSEVRTVMAGRGSAMMGTGNAAGDDRAEEAVGKAIISLLVEDVELASASGILVNITSDLDMMIEEFETVGNAVRALASESATVVVGTVIDTEMQGEMRVTLVVAGIDVERKPDPTPFSRPYFEARSVAKSPDTPVWSEPKPLVEYNGYDDLAAQYEKAVAFVVETRNNTPASVQRLLKTSYSRAAELVEKMEEQGIVSAKDANGKREVLVPMPVHD